MIVPVYKKWDSNFSRLQVIRQDRLVQLVAFFSEFSHGHCMNFILKGTDNFESFSKSGKYGIRVVDAKFALPKGEDDPSSHFVSIDLPDYPSEHDDITILFDSQGDRDRFQDAMPATVVPVSRMPSLRK
ncbi:MAG: hypothetical protein M1814_006938 [Vezdaea aestivalis]|nr:MAG: hypothetical protein M1814_006938 [Vezdaea aestivalis]